MGYVRIKARVWYLHHVYSSLYSHTQQAATSLPRSIVVHLECTSQRFQSFHSRPVEAASAAQSIAVRIVEIPIAFVVRIVVSCVGVTTVFVVVSAVVRARFRTRGSHGADIFIEGRDARVL
jgi:hypothetical protein